MADHPLSDPEITAALAGLARWKREGDALEREITFGSFREAMSFMMRVAFEAEARNHHPEWTNIYDTVFIRLRTHHSGNRITAKDVDLARAIDRIDWTG